jgi:hypothetical protein
VISLEMSGHVSAAWEYDAPKLLQGVRSWLQSSATGACRFGMRAWA